MAVWKRSWPWLIKIASLIPAAVGQLSRCAAIPPPAVPLLIEAATAGDTAPVVRAQAVLGLAKVDDPNACPAASRRWHRCKRLLGNCGSLNKPAIRSSMRRNSTSNTSSCRRPPKNSRGRRRPGPMPRCWGSPRVVPPSRASRCRDRWPTAGPIQTAECRYCRPLLRALPAVPGMGAGRAGRSGSDGGPGRQEDGRRTAIPE